MSSETETDSAGLRPLDGGALLRHIVSREWSAHRSLWLGIAALAVLLSIGLSLGGDDAVPWWYRAVVNLANATDLLALAALFGLLLAWREIRTLARSLPEEERRQAFLTGARSALVRLALPLAALMLAAGLLLRMLPFILPSC